jgi:hypothetical protein
MSENNLFVEPFTFYLFLKSNHKIKHLDVHRTLPFILYADKENNIVIYDINKKRPIRSFSLQYYFSESVKIQNIQFFNCEKFKIENYNDLTENLRIKGIPITLIPYLVIITTNKYIFFYSYMLQNFVRMIHKKIINDKDFIKCDIYSYNYAIILTEDGSLHKWNLKHWLLESDLPNKNLNGRPCVNFSIITDNKGNNYLICVNKVGTIFKIDIKKDIGTFEFTRDNFFEHGSKVNYIDFNPEINKILTVSKEQININDLDNLNIGFKIPNFEFVKDVKFKGATLNLSPVFNNCSIIVYGKSQFIQVLNLKNCKENKKYKIDSKNNNLYFSYYLNIENSIFDGFNDKETIIYDIKFLLNINEYLVIASSRGVIIYKIDSSLKASVIPIIPLNEISDKDSLYFYSFFENKIKENLFKKKDSSKLFDCYSTLDMKRDSLYNDFNENLNNRFEIGISYNNKYMSCLDSCNNTYKIYRIHVNENFHLSFKEIKSDNAISLIWCPFKNSYAIIKKNSVSFLKYNQSNKLNSTFELNVINIRKEKTILLYKESNLPSHKLFGGPFIGVFINSNQQNKSLKATFLTDYTYYISKNIKIVFHDWENSAKLGLEIEQEPLNIYNSEDLSYMIICYNDKYVSYYLNDKKSKYEKIETYYDKVLDGLIYENFVFVYLTEYGFYFVLLNEKNGFPYKIYNLSEESNHYHIKISKISKETENDIMEPKKHFQTKILGIYNNYIATSSNDGKIQIKEINHVIFHIITFVKEYNIQGLSSLLDMFEKKMIKSVLAVFDYYFNNEEEILRKIFSIESILNYELYKYLDYFVSDIYKYQRPGIKNMLNDTLEKNLIISIIEGNEKKINAIYNISNQMGLRTGTKSARCIEPDFYFNALMKKDRFFESYAFNVNYNINNKGDSVLTQAFGILNINTK